MGDPLHWHEIKPGEEYEGLPAPCHYWLCCGPDCKPRAAFFRLQSDDRWMIAVSASRIVVIWPKTTTLLEIKNETERLCKANAKP
jgi:hypothetical protein